MSDPLARGATPPLFAATTQTPTPSMTPRDRIAQVEGAFGKALEDIRWAIDTHLSVLENAPEACDDAKKMIVRAQNLMPEIAKLANSATQLRQRLVLRGGAA